MSREGRRLRKHYSVPGPQLAELAEELSKLAPSISVNGHSIAEGGEFESFKNQVAGHQFAKGKEAVGILKCKDGTILKAFSNPVDGLREANFYEKLLNTKDPSLIQLREFTSNFYGTRNVCVNGKQTEFLILQDLTEGFYEPCIIDIKIGQRTWDPLATDEKIEKEKKKYIGTKGPLGICIPGFHVYKIPSGRLDRYNKDYGKKLNDKTIYDAMRTFLNGNGEQGINKELLLEILSQLWKIQHWVKKQKVIKLYSTSILIVYDAKILRIKNKQVRSRLTSEEQRNERKISCSTQELPRDRKISFAGATDGPMLASLSKITALDNHEAPKSNERVSWDQKFQKTMRSNSFHFNYHSYLSKIKQDYATALNDLISDEVDMNKPWCVVKIIDLSHVFPADQEELDSNYINGMNNLVDILESFLNNYR